MKIGLIAGNRKFPFVFAEAARKKGYEVVAVGIKGDTLRSLRRFVDKMYWIELSGLGEMFKIFKSEGVKQVIMAGQISPWRLFSREVSRSRELKELLAAVKDKRADTIFGAIADKLKDEGLELVSSISLIEDQLPGKGVLTKSEPDSGVWEDVSFGLRLAKDAAALDIGQTVAVKSKAIVAVEALEGTDNLIRRAGKIARGGITIVKVSKPKQDLRFDVPVVGLGTIKSLVKAGAKCLAIEADKTLFIDREESVRLAERKGLTVIAV